MLSAWEFKPRNGEGGGGGGETLKGSLGRGVQPRPSISDPV